MKKLTIILTFLAWWMCAHAETVVLRTGARVQGSIVFENEDVIIIRNAEGVRFQYPKSDVEAVVDDEGGNELTNERVNELTNEGVKELGTSKKASILLEVAAGAAAVPNQAMGAAASVDLLVGSHHIGDKHVFVGGGLGYHGVFVGSDSYHFLPIQAAVRVPLIEAKHAPVFGMGVGYGIALSKSYVGGLYAGVDIGYRYQLHAKTALGAVFYTQFQQAKMVVSETVENTVFTRNTGRSLIAFGAKFTLYF